MTEHEPDDLRSFARQLFGSEPEPEPEHSPREGTNPPSTEAGVDRDFVRQLFAPTD